MEYTTPTHTTHNHFHIDIRRIHYGGKPKIENLFKGWRKKGGMFVEKRREENSLSLSAINTTFFNWF